MEPLDYTLDPDATHTELSLEEQVYQGTNGRVPDGRRDDVKGHSTEYTHTSAMLCRVYDSIDSR